MIAQVTGSKGSWYFATLLTQELVPNPVATQKKGVDKALHPSHLGSQMAASTMAILIAGQNNSKGEDPKTQKNKEDKRLPKIRRKGRI